jgi:activator of HSP90 ATPase
MKRTENLAAPANAPTRRQMITGAAIALGGLALGSTEVWAQATEEISHSAESIHLEPVFNASRNRVYQALTDAKQFNEVVKLSAAMRTGIPLATSPTVLSGEVGGAFSLFGGFIVGRHLELVPNERIVQAWRVSYWPKGDYSIARFDLAEQGAGSKIVFDHLGFPKGDAANLVAGWKSNYWEPLAKFLV